MGLKSSNHQVLQNWASLTPDRWRSRNSPFEESRIHLPSISIPKRSQNSELLGKKHVFVLVHHWVPSWFYHRVAPPHPSTDPSPFCDTRPPPYLRSTRWKLASSLGVSKICGVQHVMWWWMRSRGPSRFKLEPWVWPLRIVYFLKKWFRFIHIFWKTWV